MLKNQADAEALALSLCEKDGLAADAYLALFNKEADSFVIYPKVSTLLFKVAKTGTYAGKDTCEFFEDEETKKLLGARTTVYRLVMDSKEKFEGDLIVVSEYESAQWHAEKPYMFASKTALAVALRQAWPDILAGMISYEEARSEISFSHEKKSKPETAKASPIDVNIPTNKTIHKSVAEVFGG